MTFSKERGWKPYTTTVCTNHTRRQHVVEVLKERLILDLLVSEDEGDSLALLASSTVQVLEVIQQVGHIVGPERTQTTQH